MAEHSLATKWLTGQRVRVSRNPNGTIDVFLLSQTGEPKLNQFIRNPRRRKR